MKNGNYYRKYNNNLTDLTYLAGRLDPRRYYLSETNCIYINVIIFIIVVVLNLAESCASGDYKRRFNIVSYINEGQININYKYKKGYTVIFKFEYIVFII